MLEEEEEKERTELWEGETAEKQEKKVIKEEGQSKDLQFFPVVERPVRVKSMKTDGLFLLDRWVTLP